MQKRFKGVWETVERPLFPGYVIVDTDDPKAMSMALHSITGAIRILGNEHGYMPLPRDEHQPSSTYRQWYPAAV